MIKHLLSINQLSREDVTRIITTKELNYSLRFYFYRRGMGFPKEADCQRDVVFHLDRAELPRWIGSENHELYVKLGEAIREGRPASPGFDAAVTRHRLLDAIVRASETGQKQYPGAAA